VCATHGGYNEATRTYAGSEGTNAHCQAVLDALGAPGGAVGTLGGTGKGVGCVYMTAVDERYRIADMPTTPNDVYTWCRRACACNQ
jgi:hypothetical protein